MIVRSVGPFIGVIHVMKRISGSRWQASPHALVFLAFISYVVIFASYQNQMGIGIASLATVPVIVAGWYFGLAGGIGMAVLSILTNIFLYTLGGNPLHSLFADPGNILRIISLCLIAVVTGKLSSITRERLEAIRKLEEYENERRAHTEFLELLNSITAQALEADNLQSTLDILTEQITKLFHADDGYFSVWDADRNTIVPTTAFGSLHDIYPFIIFEPGERTLAAAVIQANHPIAVPDIENSTHISARVAVLFPNHSMLGLPLITQQRKLGALILGFNQFRSFQEKEILQAGIVAEQVALVVSKSQLLEDARKQVKQLTVLHDVALISTDADDEDHLIEWVTEIIGNNLFPDNFGILSLDETSGILHAHPSYRFFGAEQLQMKDTRLGEGITGEVARTGQPQRIGNVHLNPQYVDVDDRTISELCVPIKFKDRVLGVINTESLKRNAFTLDDERLLVTLAGQLATAIEQMRNAQAERKWMDQLAHSNDLIYSIAQITTQIEKALTTEEIIQTLGDELHSLGLTCIMAMYDAGRESFTVNYTSLESPFLKIVESGLGYPLVDYVFPRRQLQGALNEKDLFHPIVLKQPEQEIQMLFEGAEKTGVLRILKEIGVTPQIEPLRVPLVFEKNLLGMLWVWGNEIRPADLPIISIFAKQVATSLERARLFQEVQSLALTDPLTGLHNRRNIFELGRVEFSRAYRMNHPMCCMMLDLDHFKKINDDHGHQAGDHVLQEFANRCKRSVREMDMVGRYGGEELIIIMPETELTAAVVVAERLRKCVADTPILASGREISLTVSIGVAQKDENTNQVETLVARADQAMYIAKHKGRNRVATSK